ncbi:MAG: SpoIID/LytB domain-containing protein [Candidatus Eisenbacteria bacterium]
MPRTHAARLVVTAFLIASLASCAALTPVSGPIPTPTPAPPVPSGPPVPSTVPVPSTPTAPGPLRLDGEPVITVGLAWDLDTLVLKPEAGLVASGIRRAGGRQVPVRSALRYRAVGSGLLVESARGDGWAAEFSVTARETCWLAGPESEAVTATWKDKRWRGALGVFLNPRGRLTLIARLPLESYLRGVVPGEIGALGEDRIEAGKAQAIAARSYTLFYMGRRASEGFDVFATVEDQLFSPVEGERPLASRVEDETRGQVALSAGQPIRANYSSTCGGISSDVWEAWPAAPLPYLVSHRDRRGGEDWCAASTHYRWRETWSTDEFMANLARYGHAFGVVSPQAGLGDLLDVKVESRSRSGRVWRLGITTSTGRIIVPAYVLRQVMRRGGQAGSILRSNLFKVAVRRDPATRAPVAVVASGAGSGHGVGLCQTGALGMARAGEKAKAIMEHYYPSAEIRALY